ncbi:MAG: T9SS type A sorting domain-containing protein, partial [candidate division Zixibacteria bacterium]|nr:T9SS type A sorting domain-containing protein [candidate division Zixibacteria bacterium]
WLVFFFSVVWPKGINKTSFYQALLEERANLGSSGYTSQEILQQRLSKDDFLVRWTNFISGNHFSPSLKASYLLGDFRVNEENYSATFSQRRPDLALFKDGSFVSVWEDERNGDKDIFCQKVNSAGGITESNLKLAPDDLHTDQLEPSICRTLDSNLILVWVDGTELNIYARRCSPDLSPSGDTFRVNDSMIPNSAWEPEIESFTDGSFLVVWVDVSSGNNLYARRYDSSGNPLGPSFKVNTVEGIAPPKSPSASFDKNGRFVIGWEDYRNLDADIYFQRYDSSGTPSGSNVLANVDSLSEDQYYSSVTKIPDGDFMIAWVDTRGGKIDIYARLFDYSGSPKTSRVKVNSDNVFAEHWEPVIDADSNGNYLVAWGDDRDEPSIYFQKFDSAGAIVGSNVKLSQDGVSGFKDNPALAVKENGDFDVVWSDHRGTSYDIYYQIVLDGILSGSNFKLNDDLEGAIQKEPAITEDLDKNFIITWTDQRNGNDDIYIKKFARFGDLIFSERKVNTNTFFSPCAQPDLAIDGSRNILVVWQDSRDGLNIYAQRYDPSGNPVDTNFKVNNSTGTILHNSPACAKAYDGKAVVVWSATKSGIKNIYAQRFNSFGILVDTSFKVNDDLQSVDHLSPKVGMDSVGNFTVAWYDRRSSKERIYLQRYNSSGGKIGPNLASFSDSLNPIQREFDLAMNSKGNMVLTWTQLDGDKVNLYAQRYSSSGSTLGNNFLVNDISGIPEAPSVSIDDDTFFVVVWTDYRAGDPDIYYQVYYFNEGIPLGANSILSTDLTNALNFDPDVVLSPPNIYTAWMDNRIPDSGFDIFASTIKYRQTKVEEEEVTHPFAFDLAQNYPNPFNPTTAIPFTVWSLEFNVGSPIHTTLKIYNLLGEVVRTLVDDKREPGNYQVIWDGKDKAGKEVASGIYFYRLKVGESSISKRMVLLR